jgi:hypothetical protein
VFTAVKRRRVTVEVRKEATMGIRLTAAARLVGQLGIITVTVGGLLARLPARQLYYEDHF